MPDIYDQHKAAFARVSAYVILMRHERVATVAIKFPKDGAGRLCAYVHWLGVPMVRGSATGGGYDKRTAACASAMKHYNAAGYGNSEPSLVNDKQHLLAYAAFLKALGRDDGMDWTRQLENVGFTVLQAV